MQNENTYYQTYLKQELGRRCSGNSRYSLRAFAQSLDIDASALSRILSGKRPLTISTAKKMTKSLSLNPSERNLFLHSVIETNDAEKSSFDLEVEALDNERFRAVAELYHYALIELTTIEGFVNDPRFISKALGISVIEAQLAVSRLIRLGLLEMRAGKLKKKKQHHSYVTTETLIPALQRHQKETFSRAIEAIEKEKQEDRAAYTMTMAIDPARLPEARKLIQEFNRSLCDFLEGGKKRQVYEFTNCLYPLQKREQKESK